MRFLTGSSPRSTTRSTRSNHDTPPPPPRILCKVNGYDFTGLPFKEQMKLMHESRYSTLYTIHYTLADA
jgi:hypothetical protein